MGDFGFYFKEGIYHITDWKGYDHILFVMALCIPYLPKDLKQVLILITAFTIGHSITLATTLFSTQLLSTKWIEFLIPVTIIVAAFENLFKKQVSKQYHLLRYATVLVFGLIHGMGFSNYLKSMLGKSENIIPQLLAFNLGIEAGQIFIVAAVLFLTFIVLQIFRSRHTEWTVLINCGILVLSFLMAIDRKPF